MRNWRRNIPLVAHACQTPGNMLTLLTGQPKGCRLAVRSCAFTRGMEECLLVRAVVQRASQASVTVAGTVVGLLTGPGLVVLVGVTHSDTVEQAAALARKIYFLRILPDEKSCAEAAAPLLVVSQFTLYAQTAKGRRPTWQAAAPRAVAEPLVVAFCEALRDLGGSVQTGAFGADMQVQLVNDGPVTLVLET